MSVSRSRFIACHRRVPYSGNRSLNVIVCVLIFHCRYVPDRSLITLLLTAAEDINTWPTAKIHAKQLRYHVVPVMHWYQQCSLLQRDDVIVLSHVNGFTRVY
jgi:chorismate mutase